MLFIRPPISGIPAQKVVHQALVTVVPAANGLTSVLMTGFEQLFCHGPEKRMDLKQGWKPGYLALGCQFQCVETQMSGFSFGLVSRLLKNRFQFRFQFCLRAASV